MRSLRKRTRFETATLIGLIADEWQFNYIQWTMRLERSRGPRQSPALPIASAGPVWRCSSAAPILRGIFSGVGEGISNRIGFGRMNTFQSCVYSAIICIGRLIVLHFWNLFSTLINAFRTYILMDLDCTPLWKLLYLFILFSQSW